MQHATGHDDAVQVCNKEGAKQELQNHAFAYKRPELQVTMMDHLVCSLLIV